MPEQENLVKRQIEFNGRQIRYRLNRAHVEAPELDIAADGSLTVTVPKGTGQAEIDAFLLT